MDEIKRLQRAAAWQILPDRYATVRRLFIEIRSVSDSAPDEHREALSGAIQHLKDIEDKVEKSLQNGGKTPNVVSLNAIIGQQRDKLAEVLEAMKGTARDS